MKIIYQLGYKVDTFPVDIPIVDCRVIRNPYSPTKSKDQMEREVRQSSVFMILVLDSIKLLENYNSVIIACSYGRHRSGEVVKETVRILSMLNIKVEVIKGIRG